MLSRTMFSFFDDPEGPNLLVVVVMAGVIYFLSLAICQYSLVGKSTPGFIFTFPALDPKKLVTVLCIQAFVTIMFWIFLH